MEDECARILIADQNAATGRLLQKQLSNRAWRTRWQRGIPGDGLNWQRDAYHLLILDTHSTPKKAEDLLKNLRERDPELSIVILAAYPTADEAVRYMKMGASDYLRKPFSLSTVEAAVQRILEQKGFYVGAERLINVRIGQRIKEFRHRRRWTITKLASHTRLSKSLISQIENAKNSASLFSLSRIARSLTVRMMDLVQDL